MTTVANLEVSTLTRHPAWLRLKTAASELRELQAPNGAIDDPAQHLRAHALVAELLDGVAELAPLFTHDADYLDAVADDFRRWADESFGVPDFYDSLVLFQPQLHRVDGLAHLVVFPMYTQNGSRSRLVEAVLVQVIWPDFVAALEASDYGNKLFVPIRFLDFTAGYDTNAAVLFPETVAMRQIPTFTWGAIFADREAARFRRVLRAAVDVTKLDLIVEASELLDDQGLAEETFVMWDLIHDRTHMRGDLPFDPFMIKQRMPFFLYSLEELRCDLTAFRESVAIDRRISAMAEPSEADRELAHHARLVQYCVIFDRIFRFAITGNRVRNYDGLGGQLLFAWLHQHRVLHWTDTQLAFEWSRVPDCVNELGAAIEQLYWRSIDRPKIAHWLAAYELVSGTVEPHPASAWKAGDLPLTGLPRDLTDKVMDDEFPLSMFYEAFEKKMRDVIASTSGITGTSA
ncbi:DUF6421 family protein [Micropruina sp.]|uniref:DUF6421 family protein n=1 Tax=Micropruina sp. TaxID=2737536 RepID=UPI0039E3C7FD